MINIGKKEEVESKMETWDNNERYDILEKWDHVLFNLIEPTDVEKENSVDLINEFIQRQKERWETKYFIDNELNNIDNNTNIVNNNLSSHILCHEEHIKLNQVLKKVDVLLLLKAN
ncbi:hypothetical protein PFDG_04819 [Plasmodium falciparum Dd2]|nr:hypothetical protein PFDG_04819 [Plasmodium falciparum Dd2]